MLFWGITILFCGCGKKEGIKEGIRKEIKEKVELRSGKKLERTMVVPEAEGVKRIIDKIYTGTVKLVPAPGSQALEPRYKTKIMVIDLADGEMIIPVGLKVNELRKKAVDKNVVFKGRLQREKSAYKGKYYNMVEVKEIISVK